MIKLWRKLDPLFGTNLIIHLMQLSWHSRARKELCASSVYYEEKNKGLGERFIVEVESTIARILYDPESLRVFQHGCRKMSLRRFPYSIIYTIRQGEVHIVAVCIRQDVLVTGRDERNKEFAEGDHIPEHHFDRGFIIFDS